MRNTWLAHWQGLRKRCCGRCDGICERCHKEYGDDIHHTPQAYRDIGAKIPSICGVLQGLPFVCDGEARTTQRLRSRAVSIATGRRR